MGQNCCHFRTRYLRVAFGRKAKRLAGNRYGVILLGGSPVLPGCQPLEHYCCFCLRSSCVRSHLSEGFGVLALLLCRDLHCIFLQTVPVDSTRETPGDEYSKFVFQRNSCPISRFGFRPDRNTPVHLDLLQPGPYSLFCRKRFDRSPHWNHRFRRFCNSVYWQLDSISRLGLGEQRLDIQ